MPHVLTFSCEKVRKEQWHFHLSAIEGQKRRPVTKQLKRPTLFQGGPCFSFFRRGSTPRGGAQKLHSGSQKRRCEFRALPADGTFLRPENMPPACFLNGPSSPTGDYQKRGIPKGNASFFGAADGTRTRTVSLPGDFKSPVSTDSTTATDSQTLLF